MSDEKKYVLDKWGKDGERVVAECEKCTPFNGNCSQFLDHCVACGGDWGAMFLSGIKALYPNVWEAIPENMGKNAFVCIMSVLVLLGVSG